MDLKKLIDCMTVKEREELKQILFKRDNGKTDIYKFIGKNKFLRTNIKLALYYLREHDDTKIQYVEDITRDVFLKVRGVGIKSWNKFNNLRK